MKTIFSALLVRFQMTKNYLARGRGGAAMANNCLPCQHCRGEGISEVKKYVNSGDVGPKSEI